MVLYDISMFSKKQVLFFSNLDKAALRDHLHVPVFDIIGNLLLIGGYY